MNAPMLWHLHANAVLCDTVNETDDQRAYVAAHEAVLISWLQELHNYKSSVILEREVGMIRMNGWRYGQYKGKPAEAKLFTAALWY